MSRNYTRAQQRKYREERKRQAVRVADRLLGKKKVDHTFFSGTQMQTPIQYFRTKSSIITGMEGI